ncbi:chromate efflux transporter [Shewanella halotolerans]|uniref:chromate efflux transporter n=1 Tax=Shewanella halotolerans TaxID=2864204 RepID=UPI001C661416|nr:chromate efflux transporter [Shewanella halotolerans]QYJ89273.1 chromate efflux transporter [Shewanella halotolerans]
MGEVFKQFLLLGLMSFGGPAAHIGYFKRRFVDELGWLDAERFGAIVAMSQVIPGPGSSQVGFAIGHHKAGLSGALAAFLGFTLPSFLLLYLMAVASLSWLDTSWFQGLIHGLKLMAVVVVTDAVLSMFNQFCRRGATRLIMMLCASFTLFVGTLASQLGLLILVAVIGAVWLAPSALQGLEQDTGQQGAKGGEGGLRPQMLPLMLFILLFGLSLFWLGTGHSLFQLFAQFYQAGALVFGGGHVVLPLLEASVGQQLTSERFLTGYALAQAVPGPMFTLAAFLGAESWLESPLLGALVATLAIFLPGFLLQLSLLRSWHGLMGRARFRGAIMGINAAVVGLLLAALISPVIASAILAWPDALLVLTGLAWQVRYRPSILMLLLGFALAGMLFGVLGGLF